MDILKIDNFIPESYCLNIENLLLSDNFPYYFISNVAFDKITEKNSLNYDFFHLVYNDNEIISSVYEHIYPLVYFLELKLKKDIKEIIRIRIGMSTKKTNSNITHPKHLDFNFPHKTFLYYVNNSDGDTVFYENDNEVKFQPVRGSGIFFDGSIPHASSTPTTVQRRIVININFNF